MITAVPSLSAAPTWSWIVLVELVAGEAADHGASRGAHGHRREHRRCEQADEHPDAAAPARSASTEVVAGVHDHGSAICVLADEDHAVAVQLLRGHASREGAELLLGQVDVCVARDEQHAAVGHGHNPLGQCGRHGRAAQLGHSALFSTLADRAMPGATGAGLCRGTVHGLPRRGEADSTPGPVTLAAGDRTGWVDGRDRDTVAGRGRAVRVRHLSRGPARCRLLPGRTV